MTDQRANGKTNQKNRYFRTNAVLFFCILLLFVFFLIYVYRTDRKEAANLADETIAFLETVCQRYDRYAQGESAAALETILNKAQALREFMEDDQPEKTFLEQFVKTQELTGVLVTDEKLNVAGQTDAAGGDAYTLWQEYLKNENRNNILRYEKKSFCGTVTVGGQEYDLAIVARKNGAGLILCYKATKNPVTDLYEVSLEQTLTNNNFHKNPKIVITDGVRVLASNTLTLSVGMSTDQGVIADIGMSAWKNGNMIRLQWGKRFWYGKRQAYGRYYIYLFYPSEEVFTNMISLVAAAIAVYAVLCMVLMVIRRRSEKKHLEEERRQWNTIRAIGTLYSAISILHIKEKRFEGVLLTERAQRVLDEDTGAERVARGLAEAIIAPEYRKGYISYLDFDTIEERLRGRKSISGVFQDVNGVWYATHLIPMEYAEDGTLAKVLFASRDINDYKQREETYKEQLRETARDAEIANAAKTSFLRRMSHDMRTPVNGIRGMAVLAGRSADRPEEVEVCMEKIITSADQLLELLNDALQMGKLESGRIVFEEKPYDLSQVLSEVTSFIGERAREKEIHFSYDFSSLVHTQLLGSPRHLRQVLQNVLANAVKFNRPHGDVRFTAEEVSFDQETVQYEFVCSDTGIGIDEAFQKHIFEPFSQEENTARTTYSGNGLGLPIAKEILDQRGGSICFRSEKGKGSTFTVRLSAKRNETAVQESRRQEGSGALPSIAGIRVLLAEDNELNMEIARSLLEEEGAAVTGARNGQEALRIFSGAKPGTFDVILMDIMMPKMNGLEAARAIRRLERSDAERIPIFAMTANSFVEDVQKSMAAGMNEHLAKPINIEELVRMIGRYCGKQ